jgi:hypothetical protein
MDVEVMNWLKKMESATRGYRDRIGIAEAGCVVSTHCLFSVSQLSVIFLTYPDRTSIYPARVIGGTDERYEALQVRQNYLRPGLLARPTSKN